MENFGRQERDPKRAEDMALASHDIRSRLAEHDRSDPQHLGGNDLIKKVEAIADQKEELAGVKHDLEDETIMRKLSPEDLKKIRNIILEAGERTYGYSGEDSQY